MKLYLSLVTVLSVGMIACAGSVSPHAPSAQIETLPLPQKEPLATKHDCDLAYGSILGIELAELTRYQGRLTDDEVMNGIRMLDEYYTGKGITQSFYANCIDRMTAAQTQCMSEQTSMADMHSRC